MRPPPRPGRAAPTPRRPPRWDAPAHAWAPRAGGAGPAAGRSRPASLPVPGAAEEKLRPGKLQGGDAGNALAQGDEAVPPGRTKGAAGGPARPRPENQPPRAACRSPRSRRTPCLPLSFPCLSPRERIRLPKLTTGRRRRKLQPHAHRRESFLSSRSRCSPAFRSRLCRRSAGSRPAAPCPRVEAPRCGPGWAGCAGRGGGAAAAPRRPPLAGRPGLPLPYLSGVRRSGCCAVGVRRCRQPREPSSRRRVERRSFSLVFVRGEAGRSSSRCRGPAGRLAPSRRAPSAVAVHRGRARALCSALADSGLDTWVLRQRKIQVCVVCTGGRGRSGKLPASLNAAPFFWQLPPLCSLLNF